MNIDTNRVRDCLKGFDFKNLFVEELGWNICANRPVDVQIGTQTFRLTPFAEQGGMVIYLGESPVDGTIPPSNIRRVIETKITKVTHEHMIVFVNKEGTRSVWQWVRRQQGKQTAAREHTYYKGQPGDSLLQKLAGIAFSIDDLDQEGRVAIAEVTGRVIKAFDVEKVTRRFYDEFKKEHNNFSKFLKGMEGHDEVSWYTSVMLDRLMFIYFIQKKGFLDGDIDYLTNKLKESKTRGANQFYRKFLIKLFFEGFAREEKDRSPEVNQLLGKVPYLNGGLFLPHQLELAHGENINITDAAFEGLFAFFDRYNWHLDYRPLRADNEINPDILGYIFEKYVNQKQMGAYYTKEDITDYICKNTIIPFLFDKLESMRYDELHPFPVDDIEPYIYEAVKQEDYLPTETEREYQARQKRYQQIKNDFAAGKIASINDLITYNLNIRKFAEDWTRRIKDPVTLRAFYFHCLTKVTVLDPAVGSGAFLFAALNMLEPLYEICLDKMAALGGLKYQDFAQELGRIGQHPNRKYFVLKSIIVNNLFGVDIMEEAVEICKLRLFLKLASQVDDVAKIEPLPDIDFNIRAGNTLVGYTNLEQIRAVAKVGGAQSKMDLGGEIERIDQSARAVDRAFQSFRAFQTQIDVDSRELAKAKAGLKQDLGKLQDELNRYLTGEYSIDVKNNAAYHRWLSTHQPFHWFVEFYGIMKGGGFDVIIGNPPFVEYPKVRDTYEVRNYETQPCNNLYAYMAERAKHLLRIKGKMGIIFPNSSVSAIKMQHLRNILCKSTQCWISNFAWRPSKLFEGGNMLLAIWLVGNDAPKQCYSTRYLRWYGEFREYLFPTIEYTYVENGSERIPKLPNKITKDIFDKCHRISNKKTLLNKINLNTHAGYGLYYFRAVLYWIKVLITPPIFLEDEEEKQTGEMKELKFVDRVTRDVAVALLSSNLFNLYYVVWSSCQVLNAIDFEFPVDMDALVKEYGAPLSKLSQLLLEDYVRNSTIQERHYSARGREFVMKKQYFYVKESKPIIDEIDRVLAKHYGFTEDELDFIVNYDIKYRMGKEGEEEKAE